MSRLEKVIEEAGRATEGPWEVDGMDSGHSKYLMDWWVAVGEGDTICDMVGLTRAGNDDVAKDDGMDDAHFIASARTNVPAMAETLIEIQTLVRQWAGHPDVSEAVAEILARLEKKLAVQG